MIVTPTNGDRTWGISVLAHAPMEATKRKAWDEDGCQWKDKVHMIYFNSLTLLIPSSLAHSYREIAIMKIFATICCQGPPPRIMTTSSASVAIFEFISRTLFAFVIYWVLCFQVPFLWWFVSDSWLWHSPCSTHRFLESLLYFNRQPTIIMSQLITS